VRVFVHVFVIACVGGCQCSLAHATYTANVSLLTYTNI
jgi:hypothetical protein